MKKTTGSDSQPGLRVPAAFLLEELMKQLHLRRGLSLAVTIAMLLTGCSLGGDSSVPEATQTAAAVPTASAAVAAPQTTASPGGTDRLRLYGFGAGASECDL